MPVSTACQRKTLCTPSKTPMVASEQYHDGENRMLILGPDRSGRMLEVVVVPWRHPELIIHADLMRPKFHDLLRREGRHS